MVGGDTTAHWTPTRRLPEMREYGAFGKVLAIFTSNLKRIAFYLFLILKNPSTGFEVTILSFPLGCMPNITRNAIVNCAELVTYDMIKELILKYDLMTGEAVKHRHYCRNCRYQSNFFHIQMQNIKYCGRM